MATGRGIQCFLASALPQGIAKAGAAANTLKNLAATAVHLKEAPTSDDDDDSDYLPPTGAADDTSTTEASDKGVEGVQPANIVPQPAGDEEEVEAPPPVIEVDEGANGPIEAAVHPPNAGAEIRTEIGADLPGYIMSEADKKLSAIYGDHPHDNDGTHMDGGFADDALWQRLWNRIFSLKLSQYDAPKGTVGRRFVEVLSQEIQGMMDRKWNSERMLVFTAVILQQQADIRRSKDIRELVSKRLDLWERGYKVALVDDLEARNRGHSGTKSKRDNEARAKIFDSILKSGRLRQAVRNLTNREGGGVVQPDDLCSKARIPVLEVLKDKHPGMRQPDLEDPDNRTFQPFDNLPTLLPLVISADHVATAAAKLGGSGGPSQADSIAVTRWLLGFGAESEKLRTVLAKLCEWLANEHPPWAAYRALMACRLVALDKLPGTRPVGIGEILRRLMAKIVIAHVGDQATLACGNLQLCAGLSAGIEGAIHAMHQKWGDKDGIKKNEQQQNDGHTTTNSDDDEDLEFPTPITQCMDDMADSAAEEGDFFCLFEADANNGFNELNRKAMLWTVRHLWAAGSRFSFNCYRHAAMLLIIRDDGKPANILLSREGVTQGDPLSMILYGVALAPLIRLLKTEVPTVVQGWYADDGGMAGMGRQVKRSIELLLRHGEQFGYYLNTGKSICITRPEDLPKAREFFKAWKLDFVTGYRYVGGFIGAEEERDEWLEPKIDAWEQGVKDLAMVAKKYPQAAYAGLTKSFQNEWQYSMRVLPGISEKFAPVEKALAEEFLPALLGATVEEIAEQRDLLALPVKFAGLGIPDPTKTAEGCFLASQSCTKVLADSIQSGADLDTMEYCRSVKEARREVVNSRKAKNKIAWLHYGTGRSPRQKQRLDRACISGSWLTVMPSRYNGTELSQDEFRDNARIRFGLHPLGLPCTCDGCQHKFSVDHALTCKQGGLMGLRHDDAKYEFSDMCAKALKPSSVSDEPLIHSGQDTGAKKQNGITQPAPELRGDIAAHGFWRRGRTTIFDVRITHADAPSYAGQKVKNLLKRHETEKKKKYADKCAERRRDFTPLCFTSDGVLGGEADAAVKRVSGLLAKKWNRSYSDVCGFVRSRMSLALARSTTMCLRGARDPSSRVRGAGFVDGVALSLHL